jgi:ribonuclease VapC
MFVDASAVVAILTEEADSARLATKLDYADRAEISAIAIFESVAAVTRIWKIEPSDALRIVQEFITEAEIQVIEIPERIGLAAVAAFARFGKGRHAASLNLGDCFAYACAKELNTTLLFKGDDFGKTDVDMA